MIEISLKVFKFVYMFFSSIQASMHWVVTEDGMIQTLGDSHLIMQRPYDLLEWLHQDQRLLTIKSIENSLNAHDKQLDATPAKNVHKFMHKFYRSHKPCQMASKKLQDFDFYSSTVLTLENKNISSLDYVSEPINSAWKKESLIQPNCTIFTALDFSPYSFEHLSAMQNRKQLEGLTESFVYHATVSPSLTPDEFGHRVALSLSKNYTSWVLYNMAAFYWRIKGSSMESIECLRRALHYSPRNAVDVALVSLANVFHLAKYSEDASVVLQSAVKISPLFEGHYFLLSNIFAVLSKFNRSIEALQQLIHMQSTIINIDMIQRLNALICHRDLELSLQNQETKVSHTINELKKIQTLSTSVEQMKLKIQREEADAYSKEQSKIFYETYFKSELVNCTHDNGLNKDLQIEVDNLQVNFEPTSSSPHFHVERFLSPVLKPFGTVINGTVSWTDHKECDENLLRNVVLFPVVYLPINVIRYNIDTLLSGAQGIKVKEEHALPWYPPQCKDFDLSDHNEPAYDYLNSIKERFSISQPDHLIKYHREILIESYLRWLVNNGDVNVEDVGQRIFTALKRKFQPVWFFYNLAGLYWRYKGHLFLAIECQRRALSIVPPKYRDVPMVNLAAILYKWGRFNDALTLTSEALLINDNVSATHKLHSHILSKKGAWKDASKHYQIALEKNFFDKDLKKLIFHAECKIIQNETMKICGLSGKREADVNEKVVNAAAVSKNNVQLIHIYKKYGFCTNGSREMCDLISSTYRTQLPQIKISISKINSAVDKNVLFDNKSLLLLNSDVCYVFNDTTRSNGCYRCKLLLNESVYFINFFMDTLYVISNFLDSQRKTIEINSTLLSNDMSPCNQMEKFDFKLFTTVLNMESRGIDFSEIINQLQYNATLKNYSAPYCSVRSSIYSRWAIEAVGLLTESDYNAYCAEMSLIDPFNKMFGKVENAIYVGINGFNVPATLLAIRLQKNPDDWILNNLAALYWRIQGDARNAITCLLCGSAEIQSSHNRVDVALLGLANVMHNMGKLEKALLIAKRALLLNPNTLAVHFVLGNIYAAQGDWFRAVQFYQSALELQSSFKPAILRLRAIQCQHGMKFAPLSKSVVNCA